MMGSSLGGNLFELNVVYGLSESHRLDRKDNECGLDVSFDLELRYYRGRFSDGHNLDVLFGPGIDWPPLSF